MQRVCDYEGCERGIDTGHALHRVSPKGKGQPFVGMCSEHYAGTPDPVAQVIEDANRAAERAVMKAPAKAVPRDADNTRQS
jgi:hypothetical protein